MIFLVLKVSLLFLAVLKSYTARIFLFSCWWLVRRLDVLGYSVDTGVDCCFCFFRDNLIVVNSESLKIINVNIVNNILEVLFFNSIIGIFLYNNKLLVVIYIYLLLKKIKRIFKKCMLF